MKTFYLVFSFFIFFAQNNVFAAGATVIDEFGCYISPSDSGLPIGLYTTDSHAVVTPSGNTILKCHFEIPEDFKPSSTMTHTGFPCGTYLGVTLDSHSVTTRGGKVMLDCKIVGN